MQLDDDVAVTEHDIQERTQILDHEPTESRSFFGSRTYKPRPLQAYRHSLIELAPSRVGRFLFESTRALCPSA